MEQDEEINEKPAELCDSIAIGSPSKGGIVKIYGSFDNPLKFKEKIDNAKEIKKYASAELIGLQ